MNYIVERCVLDGSTPGTSNTWVGLCETLTEAIDCVEQSENWYASILYSPTGWEKNRWGDYKAEHAQQVLPSVF